MKQYSSDNSGTFFAGFLIGAAITIIMATVIIVALSAPRHIPIGEYTVNFLAESESGKLHLLVSSEEDTDPKDYAWVHLPESTVRGKPCSPCTLKVVEEKEGIIYEFRPLSSP